MALVSYDASSSDSETEENSITYTSSVLITNTEEKVNSSAQNADIFNSLPQPKKSDELIEEEQDEFLAKKPIAIEEKPKKLKQTIKIGIPSLKDFENVEEDEGHVNKPKIPKTSGLFSILPPPKVAPLSNKSFIPNVLLKSTVKPAPKVTNKNLKKIPKKFLKDAVEDSDDEGEDIEIPDTFDDETWQKVCGRKKPTAVKRKTSEPISSTSNIAVKSTPESYDGLDNVAFKELVGSNKRKKENIKLIDINEEDIMMSDKDTWLLKSLTDPDCVPKEETEEPVNDTCKKKHHITYLAQKARANEQELQSQWSQNKFTRKQTQSKYGF